MSSPQALVRNPDGTLSLIEQKPDPSKEPLPADHFLLRILHASINPSDMLHAHGLYPDSPKTGIAGFDALAEIVKAPEAHKALEHRKVAVLTYSGVYCTYKVVKRDEFFLLDEKADLEAFKVSYSLNAITAVGLVERVKELGAKGVVQNGAASNVGQILTGLLKREGIQVVDVIRHDKNTARLKKLGADEVLLTTDKDYEHKLVEAIKKHNVSVAIDCVASEEAGVLFNNLPDGGTLINYGLLSGKPLSGLNAVKFMFKKCKAEGYHLLNTYLCSKPPGYGEKVMNEYFLNPIHVEHNVQHIPLANVKEAIEKYTNKDCKYVVDI